MSLTYRMVGRAASAARIDGKCVLARLLLALRILLCPR
jgi:hypothetical protein